MDNLRVFSDLETVKLIFSSEEKMDFVCDGLIFAKVLN